MTSAPAGSGTSGAFLGFAESTRAGHPVGEEHRPAGLAQRGAHLGVVVDDDGDPASAGQGAEEGRLGDPGRPAVAPAS